MIHFHENIRDFILHSDKFTTRQSKTKLWAVFKNQLSWTHRIKQWLSTILFVFTADYQLVWGVYWSPKYGPPSAMRSRAPFQYIIWLSAKWKILFFNLTDLKLKTEHYVLSLPWWCNKSGDYNNLTYLPQLMWS